LGLLTIYKRIMPMSFFARKMVICWVLVVASRAVSGQTNLVPQGPEYPVVSAIGDQTHSQVALGGDGGYLVWQDNSVTTLGSRIRALRLDGAFNPSGAPFIVSSAFKSKLTGNQEKPQVASLQDGGAVVVWQGGKPGFQQIYTRFFGAAGSINKSDIRVSSHSKKNQADPVVAGLTDGNAVIVWSSDGMDGSMQGVFAQRFSPTGKKIGSEFQINQWTPYNQRSPAVAALANGGFVVAWISELQQTAASVDVYARIFDAAGSPVTGEVLVDVENKVCANPAVTASPRGGFAVAWSQNDNIRVATAPVSSTDVVIVPSSSVAPTSYSSNSWDVVARLFSDAGVATTAPFVVNSYTYGSQYGPHLSVVGSDYLAVWTSMGQDGSREGVFGQLFAADGGFEGTEFRVNTTTASRQFDPAVASDGSARFLAVWSSFVGGAASVDLFAQTYLRSTP
jgi:large repetitive protein